MLLLATSLGLALVRKSDLSYSVLVGEGTKYCEEWTRNDGVREIAILSCIRTYKF